MLLRWLREVAPGKLEDHGDYVLLIHDDGDVSTFYKKKEKVELDMIPDSIREIYESYDAVDLFSNTFQIAALSADIEVEGKMFIGSLKNLAELLSEVKFPEPVLPFMQEFSDMEGNQWIYAAAINSNKIYSWDTRDEVYDVYDDVEQIVGGWIEDVMETNRRDDFSL